MVPLTIKPKILLVSNLQTTLPLWAFNSLQQRLHVVLEPEPFNTIQCWLEETPDLIILDPAPPETAVLDLIRELRARAVTPIILLTSDHTDELILNAYEAGVDECILKPIHPSLFHAKLTAWLRRSDKIPAAMLNSLTVGDVQFIPMDRMIVFADHAPIRLTNLELRLMSCLIERRGHTVATKDLCQQIWGSGTEGDKVTLKNVVYRLRRKIEADPANPQYIRTVAGVGYQFAPAWSAEEDSAHAVLQDDSRRTLAIQPAS